MPLISSRVHAALLATLAVACATQLDESGTATNLEVVGGTGGSGGANGGSGGMVSKGGTSAGGTGATSGSTSSGGSSAGTSSGGSSAGTTSGGSGGSSAGTTSGGTGGSSAGTGGSGGSSAGTGGTGGSGGSGGSSGSGTSGTGGSNGSCDAPSDASISTAKCNDTVIYNNKLYKCTSQEVGQQGEATGCGTSGVRCHQIAPDDAAWGTTAWQYLEDC